jgi:starch-binding outer membrane protein, SusD/RagB family
MKRYRSALIILAVFITSTFACKKYETFPIDQVNINKVFDPRDSNGTNASAYLNSIYGLLLKGHNRITGTDYLDAGSDDAVSSNAATLNTITLLSTGAYNSGTFADAITGPTNDNLWAYCYAGIRQCNIFINNIGVVPVLGSLPNGVGTRWQWQSEARYLRAWFYFELVRRYGGVPLLGNNVYAVTDNVALPRNNFSDCITYIVNECNAIKDSLLTAPLSSAANYGRVTQGAALALKARVLLYAASPLFNGGNIDPSNPLTGYVGATDVSKWALAAQAAQDVMNLNAYSLDKTENGRDVFLTQNNSEVIFPVLDNNGTDVERAQAPPGFPSAKGTGNTSPTQDLVDVFPTIDGADIHASGSGYDPNNPYANRDPRLANTIFYNGTPWLQTSLQMYQGGQSEPNNGQTESLTGYYMKKFMGLSELSPTFVSHNEDWIAYRYAEVLLNYAEAQNEAVGADASVYSALTAIRARAGINAGSNNLYGLPPQGTVSQDSMRTLIHNERRAEMAFEEQRFFDIRRWKIAGDGPAVMNQPRRGVIITNSFGSFTYTITNVLPSIFPGTFTSRRYLYPIPYDEVAKNPQMKQNPGW